MVCVDFNMLPCLGYFSALKVARDCSIDRVTVFSFSRPMMRLMYPGYYNGWIGQLIQMM